jgi:hypothetical protein
MLADVPVAIEIQLVGQLVAEVWLVCRASGSHPSVLLLLLYL